MTSTPHNSDPRYYERDYALDRLIMLSDGVFAIAMTLMALEIRPPEQWTHTLPGLLDAIAAPFQWFFWSFFGAGIFWATHRRLFGRYTRSDAVLSTINLFLLGEITLIPVGTRLLGDVAYVRGAMWLYLGLYGMIGATNAASWLYARAAGIMAAPLPGPAVTVVVALTLMVLPVGMTALGIFSNRAGYHSLPALMPLAFAVSRGLRWFAEVVDRRLAGVALATHKG